MKTNLNLKPRELADLQLSKGMQCIVLKELNYALSTQIGAFFNSPQLVHAAVIKQFGVIRLKQKKIKEDLRLWGNNALSTQIGVSTLHNLFMPKPRF